MRLSRRRPLAAALAVAAALSLGACSKTNFDAQTNQRYQAAIGADHRGDVDVLSTLLVANPDRSGTLSAGLVNHTDDDLRLTGVTAAERTGGTALQVTAPEQQPELKRDQLTQLGRTGEDGIYKIADVPFGGYVKLTLTFSDSSEVTLEAPVVTRNDSYADID